MRSWLVALVVVLFSTPAFADKLGRCLERCESKCAERCDVHHETRTQAHKDCRAKCVAKHQKCVKKCEYHYKKK
jgi:hypothetical protein